MHTQNLRHAIAIGFAVILSTAATLAPMQAQAADICSQMRNTQGCDAPTTLLDQILSLISFG